MLCLKVPLPTLSFPLKTRSFTAIRQNERLHLSLSMNIWDEAIESTRVIESNCVEIITDSNKKFWFFPKFQLWSFTWLALKCRIWVLLQKNRSESTLLEPNILWWLSAWFSNVTAVFCTLAQPRNVMLVFLVDPYKNNENEKRLTNNGRTNQSRWQSLLMSFRKHFISSFYLIKRKTIVPILSIWL